MAILVNMPETLPVNIPCIQYKKNEFWLKFQLWDFINLFLWRSNKDTNSHMPTNVHNFK